MRNTLFYSLLLISLNFSCADLEKVSFLELSIGTFSNVTTTSLTISGEIKGIVEGTQVAEHGFVYSTINTEPDFTNKVFAKGSLSNNGPFRATITNLEINRKYYIRAFVQNDGITIFSKEVKTITLPEIPINFSKVTIEKPIGSVIFRNGITGLESIDRVDSYGHVWSNEHKAPTLKNANANSLGAIQATSVDVESTISVDQLIVLDTYYVRSFITSGKTEIYSEASQFVKGDVWSQRTDFNNVFEPNISFTFTINGELYVYKNKNEFGKYNFTTKDWVDLAPLNFSLQNNTTAFTIGSKGYVGTGEIFLEEKWQATKRFWEFDPNDGTKGKWNEIRPFGGVARKNAISFSINEKGYVGLGEKGKGDLWEFTPDGEKGSWKIVDPDYPGQLEKLSVFFALENKGCTGLTFSSGSADCWCFQPGVGWKEYAKFPANAANFHVHKFFSIGKSGFVLIPHISDNFWEFDSDAGEDEKGQWIQRADFPGGFEGRGKTFALNGSGYLGTYSGMWEYIPESN